MSSIKLVAHYGSGSLKQDEQKGRENPIARWPPQGFSDFGNDDGMTAQGSQRELKVRREKGLISEVLRIRGEDEVKLFQIIMRKGWLRGSVREFVSFEL